MSIEAWSEKIWVLKLSNEPALSDDLLVARERAAQSASMPDMAVDLTGVTHVNSSNLSQLLRLRKLAIDRSSRLRLVAPCDGVWAVLLTTGLDKVFDFAPDLATALAQLQLKPGQA